MDKVFAALLWSTLKGSVHEGTRYQFIRKNELQINAVISITALVEKASFTVIQHKCKTFT